MRALDNLNTRDSAVIDERYKSNAATQPQFDSTATIRLKSNEIDKIIYESKAGSNQFAVFSEIYYPHGWDAYIDGKKTEHIPRELFIGAVCMCRAGQHTIEFRFEPHAVIVGDKMTMWFSILLYLLLIAAIVLQIRKNKNRTRIIRAMKVISLVPYKIFPAVTGGQKNIAVFNEYLSKQCSLVCVTVKSNLACKSLLPCYELHQ